MKSKILVSAFAAFVLLFASCQETPKETTTAEVAATEPPKADLAQIRTEIIALENNWAAAVNAKDTNALMALYAEDAVSMPDNEPTLSGKAAIRERQVKEFAKIPAGNVISFETKDVYSDGNIATEVGTTTIKDAAGKVVSTGKYIAVFEKKDGKWVCIREIYNMDKK